VLAMISNMCVPICNRFHTRIANRVKITFLEGVPLFDALVQGEPPHPGAQNFVTKNERPRGSLRWGFHDPSLHHFDTDHECDRQTNGWTDRQTPRRWLRCAMHFAIAHKKVVLSIKLHDLSNYCFSLFVCSKILVTSW